jgi:NAD+ synthase
MSLTEALGVTCDRIDITPMLHVIFKNLQIYNLNNRIADGNIKARLRMIIPYYYANIFNCMVVGSTNKTELLTGFFTKYGDGGVDIMPLADLYKTQIRQLARHLKIPKTILDKPPSPGFWPGQTDEEELGVDYNTLDNILFLWEKGIPKNQIIKEIDVKQEIINNIIRRIKLNEHKRKLPAILKLNDYV